MGPCRAVGCRRISRDLAQVLKRGLERSEPNVAVVSGRGCCARGRLWEVGEQAKCRPVCSIALANHKP